MALSFLRGDADRPRGHALIVFRRAPRSDDAYVTYAVVLPIVVDPMKYLPPAFASQFQSMSGALQGLDAVPMPPVPEPMSFEVAKRLAERRDDDLLEGGQSDGSPIDLMRLAQETVRAYAEAYRVAAPPVSAVQSTATSTTAATDQSSADPFGPADDDSFRWLVMDERARIDEMTRLVGRVRDALGISAQEVASIQTLMERLASTLPLKYRASELVAGAVRPGPDGTRLAELYLDRCYRLCGEQYEGLAEIDREIARIEARD